MKPLIVLLAASGLSLLVLRIIHDEYEFTLAARIGMSAMLLFTAIGHFAFTKGMTLMLPSFVPYKTAIVYLTGLIEIAAATGLLLPNFTTLTGWLLIIFFTGILPANIYASIKKVNYQKATFDGNGINYLWLRIPLQILFIVWVYFSAIK